MAISFVIPLTLLKCRPSYQPFSFITLQTINVLFLKVEYFYMTHMVAIKFAAVQQWVYLS